MAKILKPKVKASGLLDNMELGAMKVVSENVLARVVGNSTLTSGGVKVILGGFIPSIQKTNKHVGLLSSALIVDGVEDLVHALLGDVLGGGNAGGW